MTFKKGNIFIPEQQLYKVPCQYCGNTVERFNIGLRKATCFGCKQKMRREYARKQKK